MRRLALVALVLGIAVAAEAATAAPPPGLTSYGRLVWNLDALIHVNIHGPACVLTRTRSIEPEARCQGKALSQANSWVFTFSNAHGSSLRLALAGTTLPALGNVSPVILLGRFVLCGKGRYLTYARAAPLVCYAKL